MARSTRTVVRTARTAASLGRKTSPQLAVSVLAGLAVLFLLTGLTLPAIVLGAALVTYVKLTKAPATKAPATKRPVTRKPAVKKPGTTRRPSPRTTR